MSVQSVSVTFGVLGTECQADLYRPEHEGRPLPCLVIGHGFSGTKGLARVYGEQFALPVPCLVLTRSASPSGAPPSAAAMSSLSPRRTPASRRLWRRFPCSTQEGQAARAGSDFAGP